MYPVIVPKSLPKNDYRPKPNRAAAAESIAASSLRNRLASFVFVVQCIPFGLGGRPSPTEPVPFKEGQCRQVGHGIGHDFRLSQMSRFDVPLVRSASPHWLECMKRNLILRFCEKSQREITI
jgi:hypothetical protein